jgi:hypothetical protein
MYGIVGFLKTLDQTKLNINQYQLAQMLVVGFILP